MDTAYYRCTLCHVVIEHVVPTCACDVTHRCPERGYWWAVCVRVDA